MNQRALTLQIPCSHHHIPSTTSVITSRGPYQLKGARWHLRVLNKGSATLNRSGPIWTLSYACKNVLMRILIIDLSHSRFFAKPPKISEQNPKLEKQVSRPPPFLSNACRGAKTTLGSLDDSPFIVHLSALDPSEQAEIILTLEAANNWIMFTHPLGPEKSATSPIPTGAQRILYQRESRQGQRVVEDGNWQTCLILPGHRRVDQ